MVVPDVTGFLPQPNGLIAFIISMGVVVLVALLLISIMSIGTDREKEQQWLSDNNITYSSEYEYLRQTDANFWLGKVQK